MCGRRDRLSEKDPGAWRSVHENKPASKESRPIESRSYTSSRSRSSGLREKGLRKSADAPSSLPAKIPSVLRRFLTAGTEHIRSILFSRMLFGFGRWRLQELAHLVSVKTAQIVALQSRFDTIAVALPEGNRRLIVHCGFQQDRPYSPHGKIRLQLLQQGGPDTVPPLPLGYVQRNDVRQRRVLFRQNEARGGISLHPDHAGR